MRYHVSIMVLITFGVVSFKSLAQVDRGSFSFNLVHRDSPQSPFYNQYATPSKLLEKDVRRSRARVNNSNASSTYAGEKGMTSKMEVNQENNYLIEYYIGTSLKKVFAFVDLTTDFTWLKCEKRVDKSEPVDESKYDPGLSYLYETIAYDSSDCEKLSFKQPVTSGDCLYKYEDNRNNIQTSGVLSTDKVFFEFFQDKPLEIPDKNVGLDSRKIIFGCSDEYSGLSREGHGYVGFGRGATSFIYQLQKRFRKFYYCLSPASQKDNNRLRFGNIDQTIAQTMESSPLQQLSINDSSYYLNLKGVSISNKAIPEHFGSRHLIKIDFGTSMTFLKHHMYEKVKDKVKEVMKVEPIPSSGFELCYKDEDLHDIQLPDMVFHFTEASINLAPSNMFVDNDVFVEDSYRRYKCMAILSITNENPSVLGSLAQMNHFMQFDNDNNRISFTRTVSVSCNS